jgi:hypothetical protein
VLLLKNYDHKHASLGTLVSISAHFSKIAVIQSIPSNELHTGTKLHEDLETLGAWNAKGLKSELHNVITMRELLGLLSELNEKARLEGDWPVLHFETHGNHEGLGLASGEFITWAELKIPLAELNIQTQNNLIVVVAACYGAYLTSALVPTDRAPCWGLVGPNEAMYPDDLLRSFLEFYTELFATGNGSASLKRLNAAVSSDKLSYTFSQCEFMFKMVYHKYLQDNFAPRALKKRALALYLETKRRGAAPVGGVGEIKRRLLKSREDYFPRHRENFFMFDLYPKNRERFPVTYQDVLNFKL